MSWNEWRRRRWRGLRAWVVPGLPYHVARRGKHRAPVFFGAEDYRLDCRLIATAANRAEAQIWAYCLMPNHIHLIVAPADEDGLRATFAEAHRRCAAAINARFHWMGHLYQGRFGAVMMDEPHLLAAARYIAFNPVGDGAGEPCRGLAMVKRSRPSRGQGLRTRNDGAIARADPRFSRFSRTGRSRDDGSDRAGTDDRTAAWRAPEWITAIRAPARPSPGTRQTGPKPRVDGDTSGNCRCWENSSKLSP